jgi:hypothetical protein
MQIFTSFAVNSYTHHFAKMLESLQPGMTKPDIVCCPDGHFQRAVYGLGLYIADYPEQVLLACIVQNWCPKYVSGTSSVTHQLTCLSRCTAPANGLDDDTYGCSREHADVLVQEFESGILWDVVVRIISASLLF